MVGCLPISHEAGRAAVEEAGERPYQQAVDHLRRHHAIHISKEFLEKVTQTVGQFWLERDDKESEEMLSEKIIPFGGSDCDSCCVFADGTMVHTDGDWHEVRVGTVRSSTGQAVRKSSIARFVDVGHFGADLWRKACERGYGWASLKAFIGDGSHWIWDLADLHFPDAVQILDWYHLAEHLSKCGNEVLGEGTQESRQWAGHMRRVLKEGMVEQAIGEVEKLPGRSGRKGQAKHELRTYLKNNRRRVDYPRYRSLGLPIGSGEVEAQCKSVVQARCKQSGMRWSRRGAERVLRIRCALRDGSFDTLWDHPPQSLTLWHKRRLRQQRQEAA